MYARALRASGYGVAVLRQLSWHIRFDRRANAYRRYRWALPLFHERPRVNASFETPHKHDKRPNHRDNKRDEAPGW